MATYDVTQSVPAANSLRPGDILNCPYSGAAVQISLPAGTFLMECWGAQGGSYNSSYAAGGRGGRANANLTLTEQVTAYLLTGGQGSYGSNTSGTGGGGFNGGGAAGYRGGGGGGGTDIRFGTNDVNHRGIVAGGGGGAYAYSSSYKAAGGYAGAKSTAAADGSAYSSQYSAFAGHGAADQTPGAGGTNSAQTSYNGEAGSFGAGGASHAAYSSSYYAGGAGGGGWYGGGGAATYNGNSRSRGCGGGGGNGFAGTATFKPDAPSGWTLPDSVTISNATINGGNASFTDPNGSTVTGHSGDGYIRITVNSVAIAPGAPTNLTATTTKNSATLTWTGDSLATSYRVSKDGALVEVVTGTTYTFTGLSPATQYTLAVRSVNDYGQSSLATLTVTTAAPSPDYISVFAVTAYDVILRWPLLPPDSGLTVRVYRHGTTLIYSGDASEDAYCIDTGRLPGSTYSYKACYYSNGTESDFTPTVNATTLPDPMALVTDRTAADLNEIKRLSGLGLTSWSADDKTAWNAINSKGAYNVTDVLRVIGAMTYLVTQLNAAGFNLSLLSSASGWTEGADRPVVSLMNNYLRDLGVIQSALDLPSTSPDLPESINYLTWRRANNIEQMLLDVDALLALYVQTMFPPCGDALCGGDYT